MPQVMSLRESRERAERVYLLRALLGLSWGAIRDAEGFKSVGGPQRAYERHRTRNPLPDHKSVAAEIVERKRFTTGKAVEALLQAKNPQDVATLVRAINAGDESLAELLGLNAPTRSEVSVRPDRALLEAWWSRLKSMPLGAVQRQLPVVDAEVVS